MNIKIIPEKLFVRRINTETIEYTPAEWKEAVKLQIEINQINREKRDLQERKKDLEKHFTEDYTVDQLLAGL